MFELCAQNQLHSAIAGGEKGVPSFIRAPGTITALFYSLLPWPTCTVWFCCREAVTQAETKWLLARTNNPKLLL